MTLFQNLVSRYKNAVFCWKYPVRPNSWTYRKYPRGYTFPGQKVLNVGCGSTIYPTPNVTNMDMFPGEGVNVVWDLSKTPLPFEDNTFDLIIANHILEHVPNWFEAFKELARVVKVGGIVEVWLPADGGSSQLGYRDHINVINYCSFAGIRGNFRNLTNAWEANEQERNMGAAKDIELSGPINYVLPNWWWIYLLPERVVEFMIHHFRNVAIEQGFYFIKRPALKTREEYVNASRAVRGGKR